MRVDKTLRKLGLNFAAVSICGVTHREMTDSERERWRARGAALRETYSMVPIGNCPEVVALHTVFATLGIGLRHGRPSIERMGGMLAKGRDMPVINLVADLYNLASLEHRLCMGAHDLGEVKLPIDLRLTTGAESFTPLGSEAETVRPGEFAYVDASNRVVCRLDAIQADFSKVTSATRDVLLIVEGSLATPEAQLVDAAASVATEIADATGGTAQAPVLAIPTDF